MDEIGTTAGAVGLFSDITQMERLERTRRDYVANVSHEMRTPLTAMRALIEPLKEGMVKTEDARMRYYDIILREIMRLSRLINDLMELSRLQSGTLAIRTERMKLAGLVDDVCERYRSIAEDHDISFREETDFSKVPAVVSNADRVEQLLVILLDNAIKYTPEGGTVSLDATWDEARVTLIVKDTGIGIRQGGSALCVRPLLQGGQGAQRHGQRAGPVHRQGIAALDGRGHLGQERGRQGHAVRLHAAPRPTAVGRAPVSPARFRQIAGSAPATFWGGRLA